MESPLLRRRVEVLFRTFDERQGDEEILGRIEELEAEANAIFGNHSSVVGAGSWRERGQGPAANLRRPGPAQGGLGGLEVRRRRGRGYGQGTRPPQEPVGPRAGVRELLPRSLELQEIEASELAGIMDELESATDAPFREMKRDLDAGLKKSSALRRSCRGTFRAVLPQGAGRGRRDLDRYFEGKDWKTSPERPSTASGSTCGVSSPGATSTRGRERASTPSAPVSDASIPTT